MEADDSDAAVDLSLPIHTWGVISSGARPAVATQPGADASIPAPTADLTNNGARPVLGTTPEIEQPTPIVLPTTPAPLDVQQAAGQTREADALTPELIIITTATSAANRGTWHISHPAGNLLRRERRRESNGRTVGEIRSSSRNEQRRKRAAAGAAAGESSGGIWNYSSAGPFL